jgi:hypothetical protein
VEVVRHAPRMLTQRLVFPNVAFCGCGGKQYPSGCTLPLRGSVCRSCERVLLVHVVLKGLCTCCALI